MSWERGLRKTPGDDLSFKAQTVSSPDREGGRLSHCSPQGRVCWIRKLSCSSTLRSDLSGRERILSCLLRTSISRGIYNLPGSVLNAERRGMLTQHRETEK